MVGVTSLPVCSCGAARVLSCSYKFIEKLERIRIEAFLIVAPTPFGEVDSKCLIGHLVGW